MVRSVIVGLATGLIGGGMIVPLGPVFAKVILGSGSAAGDRSGLAKVGRPAGCLHTPRLPAVNTF